MLVGWLLIVVGMVCGTTAIVTDKDALPLLGSAAFLLIVVGLVVLDRRRERAT